MRTHHTHRTRCSLLAGAFSDGLTSSGSMLEALVGALQMPSPEQVPAHIAEKRRQLTAKKRQLAMGTRNDFSMGTDNVGAKAKRTANKHAGGKIALSGASPRKVTTLHRHRRQTHAHTHVQSSRDARAEQVPAISLTTLSLPPHPEQGAELKEALMPLVNVEYRQLLQVGTPSAPRLHTLRTPSAPPPHPSLRPLPALSMHR